jgi:hypothetical protein
MGILVSHPLHLQLWKISTHQSSSHQVQPLHVQAMAALVCLSPEAQDHSILIGTQVLLLAPIWAVEIVFPCRRVLIGIV